MSASHIIDTATIDIALGQGLDELTHRSEIESFGSSTLLFVLETVFNELLQPDQVLRLYKVEIDLGEVSFHEYRDELPERLITKMREIIEEYLSRAFSQESSQSHLLEQEDSRRELLFYYLRHGSLPWYQAKCEITELRNILSQQLNDNPNEIRRFIRGNGIADSILKRIQAQFGDSHYEPMLLAFYPVEGNQLVRQLNTLEQYLSSLGSREEGSTQVKSIFLEGVRLSILKSVVNGDPSNLSVDELLSSAVAKEMAASGSHLHSSINIEDSHKVPDLEGHSSVSHLLVRLLGNDNAASDTHHSPPTYAPWLPQTAGSSFSSVELQNLHRNLERFLRGGRFETEVWEKLLHSHKPVLIGALRYYGQWQFVRQHLIENLQENRLIQLLTLIEPTEHGFIHTVVSEISSTTPPNEHSSSIDEPYKEAWGFTLAYLFVQRGSRFNKHSYLSSLIKQMANHHNREVSREIQQIIRGIYNLKADSRFTTQIIQTLEEIAQEYDLESIELTGVDSNKSDKSLGVDVDTIMSSSPNQQPQERAQGNNGYPERQLIDFFRGGPLSALPWTMLYTQHPDIVVAVLRQYGQQRDIRQRISQHFTSDMLNNIVVLLQPTDEGFIRNTVSQAIYCQRTKNPNVSENSVSEAVWEFTLAYLLLEQGSRFNRRSYLTGLIRKLADARNISAVELLHQLRQVVTQNEANGRFQLQFIALLDEIEDDLGTNLGGISSNQRLPTIYRHYEQLNKVLNGRYRNSVNAERSLSTAIEYLHKNAPWLLVRFFSELHQQGDAYRTFASSVNTSVLGQLVETYLSVSNHPEHQAGSMLRRAMNHLSANTPNSHVHYRQILDALLNNKTIDTELFATNTTLHHGDGGKLPETGTRYRQDTAIPKNGTGSPDTEYREISDDSPEQRGVLETQKHSMEDPTTLIERLSAEEGGAATIKSDVADIVRRLLDNNTLDTRRQLLEVIKKQKPLESMVKALTESLHGRLIPLIHTSAHQLMEYAEILTTAAYSINFGLRYDELCRIKWLSIYQYVEQIGGLFNAKQYVRVFLEQLSKQIGVSAIKPAARGLTEQLKTLHKSSSKHVVYHLLEGISEALPLIGPDSTVYAKPLDEEGGEDNWDKTQEVAASEEIYIENAGIVLTTPYLPMLFERLNLTKDRKFINDELAEMAIHMMQYLVKEELDTAEFKLVLNKLLCGIDVSQPICRSITLDDSHIEQLDGLLTAMIQHWTALGNTSIAGLRETFLNRPGVLRLQGDAWRLKVEEKAFDVLLDRIPWSYSTIKYPWMSQVIYVEWR